VEEKEAHDPIDPWFLIGGKDGRALLSTRPGKLAKAVPTPPLPAPKNVSPTPSATTSCPILAGGVLKTLGNPLANRSAFNRSSANLFGNTFRVGTIFRMTSARPANVGSRNPNPSRPVVCARKSLHPNRQIKPANTIHAGNLRGSFIAETFDSA
jgi:hypothetical protein